LLEIRIDVSVNIAEKPKKLLVNLCECHRNDSWSYVEVMWVLWS